MPQIRLLFLWHQHQPFYKDLVTGEYRLPWVRMHALKDYYGMVKLLDEFPGIHQNFNLVPSLILQMQEYIDGKANDPFLKVAAKPARELTPQEKQFALEYLFQANQVHMIGRYPRYQELWDRFRGAGSNPSRAVAYFQPQDFTDLQVLSQIAWFDEFFLEKSDIAELVRKGRNFSEEDQRFVIAKERVIMASVLPAHVEAIRKGAIEVSATPFYHPILPLICDNGMGAVSSPGLKLPHERFQRPDDAREQLKRALDFHEGVFGVRPKGVWPSEGSVSEQVLGIASDLGVEWMATDEGVLGRSLAVHLDRDNNGKLSVDSADRLYQIYRYERGSTRMHMVFRDHALSDLIGFVYSGMPAKTAAADFIRRIKQSADSVLKRGRDAVVPIILDGENAWEFYPESGREFLRRLYQAIQSDPVFDAVTISEAIAKQATPVPRAVTEPATKRPATTPAKSNGFGHLATLTPGSWINANFNVWIGAPEDNKSWDYLYDARAFYEKAAPNAGEPARKLAFEELLIAEGSDWNWWYGPEHHSVNDRDFDELYRKHLSNVYHALGTSGPEYLAHPIAGVVVRPSFVQQTAYIHPKLSVDYPRYFDWIGAAMYTADRRAGAMHGKQFLLDSIYAGIDEANAYGRVDFAEEIPRDRIEFVVNCETNAGSAERTAVRLEAEVESGRVTSWKLREPDGAEIPGVPHRDPTIAGSEQRRHRGVELRVRAKSFEFQLPFDLIGAAMGSTIRLRISLWRERLPVDALPIEGWIDLSVVPDEELEANVYNYGSAS